MIFPTEYEVRSTEIVFLPYHMRFSRVDIYTSRNGRLFFSQSTDKETRRRRENIKYIKTLSISSRTCSDMAEGQENVHIENVTHDEEDPYAEIKAAVERQMVKNNATMLKAFEDKAEANIKSAVKRALEKQEESGSSKKLKTELKSKGNRIRYEVNEDILKKVEAAIEAIDSKDLELAKTEMEAGKKVLKKQQKLIRMADREDNGWEVVKHYLSDELASDSEDEKAIKKARKEALASISKKKASKKKEFRNAPFSKSQQRSRGVGWGSKRYQREDYGNSYESKKEIGKYERNKSANCYRCGKEGHFMHSCPLKYSR